MQLGSGANVSRAIVGAVVFVTAGILLLLATLLVEGGSRATFVGLAAAVLILVTGILFGIPRTKKIVARSSGGSVASDAHAAQALLITVASAIVAIAASLGLAYLLRRLSRDAQLGLDLGVVVTLAASGALIYAGLLQWVLGRGLTRPES